MNKLISIILLCSLFLLCFSGCSNPNIDKSEESPSDHSISTTGENEEGTSGESTTGEEETKDNTNNIPPEHNAEELNRVFEMIQIDAETQNKINFFVEYEQIHNELKSSGQYADSSWTNFVFIVTVDYDKDMAANEDWYKLSPNQDTQSLNAAFYDQHGENLSKGEYSNIRFSNVMHLMYYSPEDFNTDYAAIKALADLDYVTNISIVYKFAVPREYFQE